MLVSDLRKDSFFIHLLGVVNVSNSSKHFVIAYTAWDTWYGRLWSSLPLPKYLKAGIVSWDSHSHASCPGASAACHPHWSATVRAHRAGIWAIHLKKPNILMFLSLLVFLRHVLHPLLAKTMLMELTKRRFEQVRRPLFIHCGINRLWYFISCLMSCFLICILIYGLFGCQFQAWTSVYKSSWMWLDKLSASSYRRGSSCQCRNQSRWWRR